MSKKRKQERYRSASTGEYVSRKYAEAHPDTTVKETDVRRQKDEDHEDRRSPHRQDEV